MGNSERLAHNTILLRYSVLRESEFSQKREVKGEGRLHLRTHTNGLLYLALRSLNGIVKYVEVLTEARRDAGIVSLFDL